MVRCSVSSVLVFSAKRNTSAVARSDRRQCSVPQVSVLGRMLLSADLVGFIDFGLRPHLRRCVARWMHASRLHMNTDKTELMWCRQYIDQDVVGQHNAISAFT
jgi:hypothetical protein